MQFPASSGVRSAPNQRSVPIEPLFISVFTHFRTQNRYAVLLEML
ncbi:hypothetical protein N183_20685 [Sinorhizobium sp. Sb3]|nr:hypothetical protein N183_20685 [Sinorhizobium sp. Sb3]